MWPFVGATLVRPGLFLQGPAAGCDLGGKDFYEPADRWDRGGACRGRGDAGPAGRGRGGSSGGPGRTLTVTGGTSAITNGGFETGNLTGWSCGGQAAACSITT